MPSLGLPRGTQGTTGPVSCLSLFLCWCKAGMKPIKSTSENMVHLRKGPGLDSSFSHRNLQLVLVWYLLKMPLMWSLLSHCIPEEKTLPVSFSARCTPLECLFQLDRLIAFVLLFMVLKPVFNPHKCSYASQFGFICQVILVRHSSLMNRTLNTFPPSLYILKCKGFQFVPSKPYEQF